MAMVYQPDYFSLPKVESVFGVAAKDDVPDVLVVGEHLKLVDKSLNLLVHLRVSGT